MVNTFDNLMQELKDSENKIVTGKLDSVEERALTIARRIITAIEMELMETPVDVKYCKAHVRNIIRLLTTVFSIHEGDAPIPDEELQQAASVLNLAIPPAAKPGM